MKINKSSIASFVTPILFGVILLFSKGNLLGHQNTTIKSENDIPKQISESQSNTSNNNQDTKSTINSAQSKINISNKNNSAKKAYDNSKVSAISVRDLLATPDKYIGKEVKVGLLEVYHNELDKNAFYTYASTDSNQTDFDASIEIFYSKVSTFDACKNLSSNNKPMIYASGTVMQYANSNKCYIQANNVWISE